MLTRRRLSAEMMDDPDVDPDDLAASLAFIRLVNRRLGGTRAALAQFKRWSRDWSGGDSIRIIDLGTGSADIPMAITRWAAGVGRRVHITAVDAHPTTLALAREHVGRCRDIEFVQADALKLTDLYSPGDFDYAHAGMFLHHLDDIEVMTALKQMDRLSRRGLIWNDLVRGTIEKILVRLLTMGRSQIIRHDGAASVGAGFTKHEALELVDRVGLSEVVYRRHPFGRFTVVSTKT